VVSVNAMDVARIMPGGTTLNPRIALLGADQASEPERAAALARLQAWLGQRIARDLRGLVQLDEAWRHNALPASAPGLAFRLLEAAGAGGAMEDHQHDLPGEARHALENLGVRFGRHALYMPSLLKPRAAHLHAVLRARASGRDEPVFLARAGAL